jgi:lactoylglutathione lyase
MTSISLSLLVLKTKQMERLVAFYRTLGITFTEERHGKGPIHFAAKIGDLVFELYPASEESPIDSSARLGFALTNLDEVVASFHALGSPVISAPQSSEWGYRAVVRDPDGRVVELYQKKE